MAVGGVGAGVIQHIEVLGDRYYLNLITIVLPNIDKISTANARIF